MRPDFLKRYREFTIQSPSWPSSGVDSKITVVCWDETENEDG